VRRPSLLPLSLLLLLVLLLVVLLLRLVDALELFGLASPGFGFMAGSTKDRVIGLSGFLRSTNTSEIESAATEVELT